MSNEKSFNSIIGQGQQEGGFIDPMPLGSRKMAKGTTHAWCLPPKWREPIAGEHTHVGAGKTQHPQICLSSDFLLRYEQACKSHHSISIAKKRASRRYTDREWQGSGHHWGNEKREEKKKETARRERDVNMMTCILQNKDACIHNHKWIKIDPCTCTKTHTSRWIMHVHGCHAYGVQFIIVPSVGCSRLRSAGTFSAESC